MDCNRVCRITYYDNGNRESVIYQDGTKEEYTYYENNWLKSLVNKRADGSIMDTYGYTYDAAGNQLTKYEVINGLEKGLTSYTYDALNRLETVTEPSGRIAKYTYDQAGNRKTETIITSDDTTVNTYSYNDQNRLTDITTKVNNVVTEKINFTYDNNGNQLTTVVETHVDGRLTESKTTSTNIYDERNQLITSITEDGTQIHNNYNGEGYRTVKEVNGEVTYYLYEADKVILEVDADGNQIARNVYGTNLLMRSTQGETYYYLYNGHGDVTALITADGTIAATYYYDAFGNILESTGEANNNILYSGYQYDKETGLYYLNARMYDPKMARFLQEDTYTGDSNDPLSLNLYTYCHNNPIIYWDPTGHELWKLSTLLKEAGGYSEVSKDKKTIKVVANGRCRIYKANELFKYEDEYIIDDKLFMQDFKYKMHWYQFGRKKLKLNSSKNDIRKITKLYTKYELELIDSIFEENLFPYQYQYMSSFVSQYGELGLKYAFHNVGKLQQYFENEDSKYTNRDAYSFGLINDNQLVYLYAQYKSNVHINLTYEAALFWQMSSNKSIDNFMYQFA